MRANVQGVNWKKLALITIPFFIVMCTSNKEAFKKSSPNNTIVKVDGKPATDTEFKEMFHPNEKFSQKNIHTYLDSFTNVQLKLTNALAVGIDTLQDFKSELDEYRTKFATPYFTDSTILELLAKEAHQRMSHDVNIQQVFKKVSPYAYPADTLQIFNELTKIRKQAIEGISFDSLVVQHSEEPGVKKSLGKTGYFTALQISYAIETASYTTPVNNFSEIVRSPYGYHLVKVLDKRPATVIKISQLMIKDVNSASPTAMKFQKIIAEYTNSKNKDTAWYKLVDKYSEDETSKFKAGELPPFNVRQVNSQIYEAAYNLENIGDISEPMQTNYGWHLIRLISKEGIKPYEVLKNEIQNKILKDERNATIEKYMVDKWKKEHQYIENEKALQLAFSYADSSLITGHWQKVYFSKGDNNVLFTIKDTKYKQKQFFKFVTDEDLVKLRRGLTIDSITFLHSLYDKYVGLKLKEYEDSQLEKQYPEFNKLMSETKNSLLVYRWMNSNVWLRASMDTSGLKKLYESNKSKYVWKDRAVATVFQVDNFNQLERLTNTLDQKTHTVNYNMKSVQFPAKSIEISETIKGTLYELVASLLTDTEYLRDTSFTLEVLSSSNRNEKGPSHGLSSKRGNAVYDLITSIGLDKNRVFVTDLKSSVNPIKDTIKGNNKVTFRLYSTSDSVVVENLNREGKSKIKYTKTIAEKDDNSVFGKLDWSKKSLKVVDKNHYNFVKIQKVIPSVSKSFEESKPELVAEYEIFLEKELLKYLKSQYKVEVIESNLNKLTIN